MSIETYGLRGFWLRSGFDQQVFDVLKEAGLYFNVRRQGDSLLPSTGAGHLGESGDD